MSLKDKLRELKKQEEAGQQMLEESKTLWVQDCDRLMSEIKQWISAYEMDGLASVRTEPLTINEERVTPYTVSQHSIDFMGRGSVRIRPIGTFLIGAHGRIDVIFQSRKGPQSSFMLIRRKDDAGRFYWKIVEKENRQKVEADYSIQNFEAKIEQYLDL
ncbi:MAG: hypothetical protein KDA48_09550 [Amphiplicatus sp.]|nr:hypothetical protein [Amphiplicatus sp.]